MVTRTTKRVRSYNRYPEHLKRKIAKSYLAGEASYAILAEENGLNNKDVVKEFVKWYKSKLAAEPKYEFMSDKKQSTDQSQVKPSPELKKENAELKRLLKLSELKTEGLETMINIAEETLKIDIRKKSGAKRSKR
mgnify:CR=1 FL=1